MGKPVYNKSENLKAFQDEARENTYRLIDEAILRLRELGIPITKKAISEEAGIHPNTLSKAHVKEHLSKYPEFSSKQSVNSEEENTRLKARIKSLEDQLAHSRNYNARLIQERDTVRKERDEYEYKYRSLLGKYQIDVGKKRNSI